MTATTLYGGTLPDVTHLLDVLSQVDATDQAEDARRHGIGVGILDHRDTTAGRTHTEVSAWSVVIGEDRYTLIQVVVGVMGEDGQAWAWQTLTRGTVTDLDHAETLTTTPRPGDWRTYIGL